jgi:uncharacterized protein with HEPN domain
MYDKALALEILQQVQWSVQTIQRRFQSIQSLEDFTASDAGLEKLDAICMQLIVLGESLKNLDKATDSSLLLRYPTVDWRQIKGMRDVISHHYFNVDAEVVYTVCTDHIAELANTISIMLEEFV